MVTGEQYVPPRLTLEPLLLVGDVAAVLRKSRTSVYRLVAEGELHPIRVGQHLRFEAADVRGFIERRKAKGVVPD